MKKQVIYLMTLLILSMAVWSICYFYREYRPITHKYGTFVEVMEQEPYKRELCA